MKSVASRWDGQTCCPRTPLRRRASCCCLSRSRSSARRKRLRHTVMVPLRGSAFLKHALRLFTLNVCTRALFVRKLLLNSFHGHADRTGALVCPPSGSRDSSSPLAVCNCLLNSVIEFHRVLIVVRFISKPQICHDQQEHSGRHYPTATSSRISG
jgi:hypothetical protein